MTRNNRFGVAVCLVALAIFTTALAGGVVADTSAGAGAVAAGDQPTQIYTEPEVYTVTPGETMEMNVWVRSDGGVGDVAVESITFNATYDESVLTVTDVEPRPWLEGDEPTDVRTEIRSADGGRVTVEQWREPPAGGTQGNERFVTLTVDVADDAPVGNTSITYHESDVLLTDQYPVPIFAVNSTLTVEKGNGGGLGPATGAAVVGAGAILVLGVVVARRL